MAKAKQKRKQRLKVYCTPVGFHNALVAAPSQKAALEAWGADGNLFAQGVAQVVTDPELTKLPLENPGQVVKMLRGTKAEQLAALERGVASPRPGAARSALSGKGQKGREAKAEVLPRRPKKRPPRPSRAAIEEAQAAVERLEKEQRKEMREIEREEAALSRKREQTERRHERAAGVANDRRLLHRRG